MPKYLIDTDTASDDAIALIMALRDPSCEVLAITTVFGNVDIETATKNALLSIEMAEVLPVPVYQGMDRPILRPRIDALDIHGQDGLSQQNYPNPSLKKEAEHALNAIIRILRQEKEPIRIICLGPLTNIALALRKAPDIQTKIQDITLMGGAQLGYAGYTEVAEFNIFCDPEAAAIVFNSGIPLTMIPLEVCSIGNGKVEAITSLNAKEIAALRALHTQRAQFAMNSTQTLYAFCSKLTGFKNLQLPDPTAITVALRPQGILSSYTAYVQVDLVGPLTYGQTVINVRGGTALDGQVIRHNVKIISAIDGAFFKAHLTESLS